MEEDLYNLEDFLCGLQITSLVYVAQPSDRSKLRYLCTISHYNAPTFLSLQIIKPHQTINVICRLIIYQHQDRRRRLQGEELIWLDIVTRGISEQRERERTDMIYMYAPSPDIIWRNISLGTVSVHMSHSIRLPCDCASLKGSQLRHKQTTKS